MTIPARSRTLLLSFSAALHSYVGLAFGVAFLNLITLGLYKPYGLTRVRRKLYHNIWLGRDAFTYEGTASALSKVTFYPSLAFLFLLIVPSVLQFFTSWTGVAVLSVVQMLLLAAYYHYIFFLRRRYEFESLTWKGQGFCLEGSAITYMLKAFGLQALVLLTLGLLAPWRRAVLARLEYDNLYYGKTPVRCDVRALPLYPLYLMGWILTMIGLGFAAWYYWHFGIEPAVIMFQGGAVDPAMAAGMDANSLSASSGMPGPVDPETMAEIGTFMNALTLGFTVYPAWILWRMLCLCLYEEAWQRAFTQSLACGSASVRYEGNVISALAVATLSFIANYSTVNLTRPFTTYFKLHLMCRSFVVTGVDDL